MLHSWLTPAAIIALGCLGIVAIHRGWFSFSAKPSRDFLIILAVMEILCIVWVRAFSQLRLDRQVIAICAFVAVQAGLHQVVRLDGFAGDGRPIWTWSWIPPPEDAASWETKAIADPSGKKPLITDFSHPSPHDYPSFRGRNRDGCAEHSPIALDWNGRAPRLLWKRAVGAGWSSFAIVGDYCVTHEQRGAQEATVCYALRTGDECWVHTEKTRFYEATSGVGPRATPTIEGGRVYSLGATGILNCLVGETGQQLWNVNILSDNHTPNLNFGVTGSPLAADGKIFVNPGGKSCSLVAYDADSGRRIWSAGIAGASYSSPQFARLCGQDQVLDFNAEGLFGHDLRSGKLLWSVPWISNPAERNNVCQPVVLPRFTAEQDCVLIASGYGMGCALLHIRQQEKNWLAEELWRNRNLKAKFSSVIAHQGHVYGLDDAILTCVEISSGKRCWKGGRYGYGQLLLAGPHLIVQLETGEIALVEPSPKAFRERTRFSALSARTWNHPVVAGPYLLVRNDREAACFELPLESLHP